MSTIIEEIRGSDPALRQEQIVNVLVEAFSELMTASPQAFRRKFRKMAGDPFAFYRGGACLFYADMAHDDDPWVDTRTSRVWIQGDLHAENFGTYMDSSGVFIFDVNDFDEAYVGHYTWDIKRLAASIALQSWVKAIPDEEIASVIEVYVRSYLARVREFAEEPGDASFSLRLDNTDGAVLDVLVRAKLATRIRLLERDTVIEGAERLFRRGGNTRELEPDEFARVSEAYETYLETIPQAKRAESITYNIKDIVGRSGFGIGSAGLPAYNILVEGHTQALENDVILSMKQGNVAAPSRIVVDEGIRAYFADHGHRTAVSQRALQKNADPWLGHTRLGGVGFVVRELSPYESDLDWSDLTEPDDMTPVLDYLGQATAKMHCVSDEDSDHTLVDFQTENAIMDMIEGKEDRFVADMVEFGLDYAELIRDDRRLFVDAFRGGLIPGVQSTSRGSRGRPAHRRPDDGG